MHRLWPHPWSTENIMSKVANAFLHLTETNPQEGLCAPTHPSFFPSPSLCTLSSCLCGFPPGAPVSAHGPEICKFGGLKTLSSQVSPQIHEWKCVFYSSWSRQNSFEHPRETGSEWGGGDAATTHRWCCSHWTTSTRYFWLIWGAANSLCTSWFCLWQKCCFTLGGARLCKAACPSILTNSQQQHVYIQATKPCRSDKKYNSRQPGAQQELEWHCYWATELAEVGVVSANQMLDLNTGDSCSLPVPHQQSPLVSSINDQHRSPACSSSLKPNHLFPLQCMDQTQPYTQCIAACVLWMDGRFLHWKTIGVI